MEQPRWQLRSKEFWIVVLVCFVWMVISACLGQLQRTAWLVVSTPWLFMYVICAIAVIVAAYRALSNAGSLPHK